MCHNLYGKMPHFNASLVISRLFVCFLTAAALIFVINNNIFPDNSMKNDDDDVFFSFFTLAPTKRNCFINAYTIRIYMMSKRSEITFPHTHTFLCVTTPVCDGFEIYFITFFPYTTWSHVYSCIIWMCEREEVVILWKRVHFLISKFVSFFFFIFAAVGSLL